MIFHREPNVCSRHRHGGDFTGHLMFGRGTMIFHRTPSDFVGHRGVTQGLRNVSQGA